MFLFLAFQFETALAQDKCVDIYSTPIRHDVNYRTKTALGPDGKPITWNVDRAAPLNIQSPVTDFIISVSDFKKGDSNRALLERNRKMNHTRGSIHGIGAKEQWLYFTATHFNKLLSLIRETANLNNDSLKLISDLMSVHPQGLKLEMSDNPQEFDLSHATHRFAKTTGKAGDPIYVNSRLLGELKIEDNDDMIRKNQAPYGYDFPAYASLQMKFSTRAEIQKAFGGQADKDRLVAMFSMILHEAAHYLKLPDDPQHSIDKAVVKIAKALSENIESVDMNIENHNWIKYVNVHTHSDKSNSQLLLFDGTNVYDITNALLQKAKQETSFQFNKYSFINMRMEDTHSVDINHATRPMVMAFDLAVDTVQGTKLVPMRIVNYYAPSITKQLQADPSQPWRDQLVQLKIDSFFVWSEAHVLKDKISDVGSIEVPRTTQYIYNQKKDYSAGETWKSTTTLELDSTELPTEATVYFSDQNGINSGFVKKTKAAFSRARIESAGAKNIFVHAEHDLPTNMKDGTYFISRVVLKYKSGRQVQVEPNVLEDVRIHGEANNAGLEFYGLPTGMLESPKLRGPKPRVRLNGTQVGVPFSKVIPVIFEIDNVSQLRRMSLHGYAAFKDQNLDQRVVGLHMNIVGGEKSPLIQSYSVNKQNGKLQVTVYLVLPQYLNNQKVAFMGLETVYVQDQNMKEFLDPAPMDIGIDVQ